MPELYATFDDDQSAFHIFDNFQYPLDRAHDSITGGMIDLYQEAILEVRAYKTGFFHHTVQVRSLRRASLERSSDVASLAHYASIIEFGYEDTDFRTGRPARLPAKIAVERAGNIIEPAFDEEFDRYFGRF